MGNIYSQLDLDERIELSCLRDAGCSRREIGRLMRRSHTTIGRELKRNSLPKAGYKPARADIMAGVRRDRPCKLQRLSTLRGQVHGNLAMGWSPQQIAGRLRQDGSKHTISHETIYRYIYRRDMREERLHRYLARAKAKRGLRYFKRRREPLPERMNIANRPQAIEDRQQFGHWEGDLIQFRTQRGAVLNVTERTTRFALLSSLPDKRATNTAQAIVDAMEGLPDKARRSLTFDRGTEFANHQTMTDKLGVDVWYCDPHSPWQRGMIENTNGILRRDMPRKTDIKDYTDKDITTIQHLINSTPRKCLGYRTPEEAFIQMINQTSGALEM
jgi:IS30 family transposase